MLSQQRTCTFSQAILETLDFQLSVDPSVYVMGLGVPDPKGIFGTTLGLEKKHGSNRVMDMPTSENGMTGIAIGSALNGMKPIMTHQRADFFLLAFDQLINSAAKWNYMFAGKQNIPLVIRLIVGRGWGQGPQHSQNLHSCLAHFPGLKVVMPTTPYDAKGLLQASIKDPNPVIFIEHRWLHHLIDYVPEEPYEVEIGKAKIIKPGDQITIVASSQATLEALKAAEILNEKGVSVEVIDLRTIKPLDFETIKNSVKKTGRLIVVDHSWKTLSIASEIITLSIENCFKDLKNAPLRLTLPDCYAPTAHSMLEDYYPSASTIIEAVTQLIPEKKSLLTMLEEKQFKVNDTPDKSFKGPF